MESVWVLPRSVLFELVGEFQGFRSSDGELLNLAEQLDGAGEFRPRAEVEEDPSLKQIIPYVAVQHEERYLRLRRLKTQGEARLHNRLSIGIGGHINPETEDGRPLLVRGLEREFREELEFDSALPSIELLGFVNDDSNAVGAVHFGIACRVQVEGALAIRERDLMVGEWCTLEEIAAERAALESWSAFLLDGLLTI